MITHRPCTDVADARLYYEVRGHGPLVVLVGAPMDAESFAPLADLLAADHTVLTTDPRGINRSTVADPEQDSTPQLRADDLAGADNPRSTPVRPRCSAPAAARSACWRSPRPTRSWCTR